jgi:hypothetical protein
VRNRRRNPPLPAPLTASTLCAGVRGDNACLRPGRSAAGMSSRILMSHRLLLAWCDNGRPRSGVSGQSCTWPLIRSSLTLRLSWPMTCFVLASIGSTRHSRKADVAEGGSRERSPQGPPPCASRFAPAVDRPGRAWRLGGPSGRLLAAEQTWLLRDRGPSGERGRAALSRSSARDGGVVCWRTARGGMDLRGRHRRHANAITSMGAAEVVRLSISGDPAGGLKLTASSRRDVSCARATVRKRTPSAALALAFPGEIQAPPPIV